MKTNKIVMLSIALLMVNSGAFASESSQEKVKKATKNALSKIADAATNTVSNVVSSAVQVVKDHPVATIVAGTAVFAGVVGTETGRNAFKSAKDAVANGVSSAATAFYNCMPANLFGHDASTSNAVGLQNVQSVERLVHINKGSYSIKSNKITGDFLSLNLLDESVKKSIAYMFDEALDFASVDNDDFQINIDCSLLSFCIKLTLFEPKDTPLISHETCIFCQKNYAGAILEETHDTIAFKKGKKSRKSKIDFLITPKAHAVNYKDSSFTSDMFINQLAMAQEFAKKLHDPKSVKLHVNNGKGAGQTVFHSHMHFWSNSDSSDINMYGA